MLKELGKYFDHYTINARFMPAFFAVLPFALTMLAWCPSAKSIMGGSLTILISFGVMTFISTLISNFGNKYQEKLFSIWGGIPTTVILRHEDSLLDKYTKQRYHKWLNDNIAGLDLPGLDDEKKNPADADLRYQSATNFLREYTRDKARYPAVYRDNVAYGFSRNLLAIRNFGLSIALICVMINVHLVWLTFDKNKAAVDTIILNDYILGIGAGLASIIFVLAFLLVVNSHFVKERGFRYAKSLLESCEIKKNK